MDLKSSVMAAETHLQKVIEDIPSLVDRIKQESLGKIPQVRLNQAIRVLESDSASSLYLIEASAARYVREATQSFSDDPSMKLLACIMAVNRAAEMYADALLKQMGLDPLYASKRDS